MPTADELFQAELEQRGLKYTLDDDRRYHIAIGNVKKTANLDNVRLNYERDKDPNGIVQFVEQLTRNDSEAVPTWSEVQEFVRYSLEPSDYEPGLLERSVHEFVTENLIRVFVYVSPDGSRISWITDSMLETWQVSLETITATAEKNIAQIVSETELECAEIDGAALGMLNTEETPFKASLILSPAFRDLVSPTHGWPVYVVVPARDFVYVIAKADSAILSRMGAVVRREYNESGYPITLEVLEVSDQGIKSIGTFAPRSS